MHCVKRKFDFSVLVLAQHAGNQQRVHVAMDGFHVPPGSTRGFPKRHRTAARHCLEQLPPFGGQNLPEQVDRRKGDVRAATLAGEGIERTLLHGLAIGDRKRHGLHFSISSTSLQKSASNCSALLKRYSCSSSPTCLWSPLPAPLS